jgi:murein DD-endopeptidase MepM/ murein hydrolase activator NlpD
LPLFRTSGFTVVIVRDDGRRIGRFSAPRWLARAASAVGVMAIVANVAMVADYASVRHGRSAPAALLAASVDQRTAAPTVPAPQPATPDSRAMDMGVRAVTAGSGAAATPSPVAEELTVAREELASVRQQLATTREQLAQKARTLEPFERRLAEVRDEVRGWDGLHAAILKPLSGERRSSVAAAERNRTKSEGTPLEALTTVLARVREESHRLSALAVVTREAASIIAAMPSRLPLRAGINSGFGMRDDPFTGIPQFHAGIDLAARTGTPVSAAAGGVVLLAGPAAGYGNTVVLDHGRGFETRYGHLDSIRVAKGQRVERGEPIGLTGNTGRSTAPHLHYEVLVDGHPVDPRRLVRD